MVKFYILTFQRSSQDISYPSGKMSCPFTNYSQHLPRYNITVNFPSQYLTSDQRVKSFNLGVTSTSIGGWMYGESTGQLFGSLIWIKV
jgi:hypothetical protein